MNLKMKSFKWKLPRSQYFTLMRCPVNKIMFRSSTYYDMKWLKRLPSSGNIPFIAIYFSVDKIPIGSDAIFKLPSNKQSTL